MKVLIDKVLRPLAAFALAAVVANCNEGCAGWQNITPAEAYAMEVSGCVTIRNTRVMGCAAEAGTVPEYLSCREDAEEEERKCRAQVDRKYLGYNSNGNYPSEPAPPSR